MSETVCQTRDDLLDAAEEVFSRAGYASAGTREIAEHAGANLASIRYHFGSKRELYLETVQRVMSRNEHESAWGLLREVPEDRPSAAHLLARFVRSYLRDLLDETERPTCGALMMWEAVRPSEAIDSVVQDYVLPSHEALLGVVGRIVPDSERAGARLHVFSVIGQLLHYFFCRSFIERLEAKGRGVPIDADEAARHITMFSLRAMGCDDAFIEDVLRSVDSTDEEPETAGVASPPGADPD